MTLDPPARLGVVGLGVVGIPVACAFAEAGFHVTGVDVDPSRVEALQQGRYPLEGDEPGLPELVADVAGDTLEVTDDHADLAHAEAVLVCVQTPLDPGTRRPDPSILRDALAATAPHLPEGALVVVESTIAPGTTADVVVPTLEEGSGMEAGEGFDVAHCPERVTPGRLLRNLVEYDRVVGGWTPRAAERAARLYGHVVKGQLDLADATTAETVKCAENAYRDVQIAFANELARICEEVGVDAYEVRDLVNRVEGRNVLFPGAGVGGHCLPKDTWLLAAGARDHDPELLGSARRTNDAMPAHTADLVVEALDAAGVEPEDARVAILGAGYREGTGDVRNAPAAGVAKALEDAGCVVAVHDPYARSLGDRDVEGDLDAAIDGADACVLVTAHEIYRGLSPDDLGDRMAARVVVDGRRVFDPATFREAGFVYRGVGRPRR